jgi:hypothetical protein
MEYHRVALPIGSAFALPGGFRATRRLLDKALEPGDLRILEVGCGMHNN